MLGGLSGFSWAARMRRQRSTQPSGACAAKRPERDWMPFGHQKAVGEFGKQWPRASPKHRIGEP